MRTQLAQPDEHLVLPATYDELFTTHGVTMIFLFRHPDDRRRVRHLTLLLMIGARDMAFPRLNALSFWLFLGLAYAHLCRALPRRRAECGLFDYVPLGLNGIRPRPQHRL